AAPLALRGRVAGERAGGDLALATAEELLAEVDGGGIEPEHARARAGPVAVVERLGNRCAHLLEAQLRAPDDEARGKVQQAIALPRRAVPARIDGDFDVVLGVVDAHPKQ